MQTDENMQRSGFWGVYLIILAWVTSFSISCWITSSGWIVRETQAYDSIAGMALGESKVALTGYFYEQADAFFHGGWEHARNEALRGEFFQQLKNEISPRFHIHLSGSEVKEIMPWMKLATIMDPHDVRIFLDAAFWLAHEARRPELAEQVLLTAQINNPFNHDIQLERGRLFLMEKKIEDAKRAFDAGLAFWPGKDKTDDNRVLDAKSRLLLYRALLHEAEGNKAEAIECLKEIIRIFPDRTSIAERIKDLEKGTEPSLLASKVWSDMLRHDSKKVCGDNCEHPEKD